jgi:hypothetical protein
MVLGGSQAIEPDCRDNFAKQLVDEQLLLYNAGEKL